MRQTSIRLLGGPAARLLRILAALALLVVALVAPLADPPTIDVMGQGSPPSVSPDRVMSGLALGASAATPHVANQPLAGLAPLAGPPIDPPVDAGPCYEPARPCGPPAVAPSGYLVVPTLLALAIVWPTAAWARFTPAPPESVWAAVPTGPPR